jgi:uncharacterized protein YecE (DUF72 family)
VPDSFTLSLKASQRITHHTRLKAESQSLVEFLLKNTSVLGDRLGPILFQLPPNLKKDIERLKNFLGFLPTDRRYAFEFRNDTWFDDEVYAVLKNAGAALCLSDREDSAPPPLVETAPFGYVRLRLETYTDADLQEWARTLRASGWHEIYVYFMHEATAPGYALKLMQFAS